MFRNQYDTDVTTWSPQGRLHQVEYAMEAVKQGSAVVAAISKTHAVLATLKRASSDLASFQEKIYELDEHCGMGMCGLTADSRVLCRFMRTECQNQRFVYESPLPVVRLAASIANKSQKNTWKSWKRPYGVGLLIIGHDSTGPHLCQTCPSGNYFEYKAMAIGSRSQSAKTYLEKHLEEFPAAGRDELISHVLYALRESATDDLTAENCSLAVVGAGESFTVYKDESVKVYVDALEKKDGGAAGEGEAMETE